MNKIVKALKVIIDLNSDEETILNQLVIESEEKKDDHYFFYVVSQKPLPIQLLEKISCIKHIDLTIYIKITAIKNIDNEDIGAYLAHVAKKHKQYKLFNKMIDQKRFCFKDNVLEFYYFVDSEVDEINHLTKNIDDLFKSYLAINLKMMFVKNTNINETLLEKQRYREKIIAQKKQEYLQNTTSKNYEENVKINGKITALANVMVDTTNVNVQGEIFAIDIRDTKKALTYKLFINDYEGSFMIKYTFFKESNFDAKNKISESFFKSLNEGDWVLASLDIRNDKFEREVYGQIKKIKKIAIPSKLLRKDDSPEKRIELMVHTKMSAFDGINDPVDVFKQMQAFNISAIGICDRYNTQIYPLIQKLANTYKIKPLYGCEFRVLPNLTRCVLNQNNELIHDATFVVFDLETTGLYAERDDIIEFGAIKVQRGAIIDRTQFFIKPTKHITNFITNLTGISDQDVKDAISQEEGIKKIIEYIRNYPIIAHNAINFDYAFLNRKAEKYLKYTINNPVIDTLHISRAMFPNWKSHRLQKICNEFKIEYLSEDAHRADYDAKVLYECWLKFVDLMKDYNIKTIADINNLSSKSLTSKYQSDFMAIYAKNQKGLKWMNELISYAHTKGLMDTPTIHKLLIENQRENLIIACSPIEGEVMRLALHGTDEELKKAIIFYDFIFIVPPSSFTHLIKSAEASLDDLQKATLRIINLSIQLDKKVVAVSNSYYLNPWDKKYQYVFLYAKALGGIRHRYYRNYKELPDSYIRTTQEMIEEFSFVKDNNIIKQIVINNTHIFNDAIENVKPIQDKLYTPKMDNVDNLLKEKVYETAYQIYGNTLPSVVDERLTKELGSIINNEFSVIYWISHLLVKQSLSDGYVVGSRGSVGSSLVATMLNITDVNPLVPHYICHNCHYFEIVNECDDGFDLKPKLCPMCNSLLKGDGHNIPFETFLGFKCDKVPDIDLNFSGLYQITAHNFIKKMFGADHTFRAGTISTIANKTSFGYVKAYFDEIQRFNVNDSEINLYTKKCVDVKRTTGQHPGGILIVPKEYSIYDFCPYNFPADDASSDWYTTHYAFEYLHDNLLKFDILGHDNPTILKMLKDLTGIDERNIPNYDEKVIKLFTSTEPLVIIDKTYDYEKTGAISIPEFGTKFVREMLVDTQPSSFSDLIRISGLSHGTNVYIGNAKSLIKNNNLKLKDLIACRDDILIYLLSKGIDDSISFQIMEDVRKGKKLKEEYIEIMLSHNVPEWYIESCNKIAYIFPKAHATAYVMHAWKFAWYKIYYPLEYYATFLSTKPDVFDIETIIKGQSAILSKRNSILELLANKTTAIDVKKKDIDLLSIFEVVLEMIARGFIIEKPNINISLANNFIIVEKKLIAPFSSIDGIGIEVAQSILKAREDQPFISIDDLIRRTKLNKTNIEILRKIGVLDSMPNNDQIKLFEI